MTTRITTLHKHTELGEIGEPYSHDHSGKGGDTPRYSIVSLSPTTSNITASVNTIHLLDVSGLTAERNFVLPSGTVGDIIEVKIVVGDPTYELVLIGDTGITINGGIPAREWSRVFITGETVKFVATSTSNWEVDYDGRIPCIAVFTRTSTSANTTHSADTDTKADWNTLETDRGNMGDLTNDRANIRRDGYYKCSGAYAPAAAITDQKWINIKVWKNGTGGTKVQAVSNRQSAATTSSVCGVSFSPKQHLCTAGNYLEYYFNTEEANRGLLNTDFSGSGASVLAYVSFFSVEEVL